MLITLDLSTFCTKGAYKMSIYTPKGKAREYSPLALNIYRGCDHQCAYCYVNGMFGMKQAAQQVPVQNVFQKTKRLLEKTTVRDQVFLSFLSDPYGEAEFNLCLTRDILGLFRKHNVPTAILTKSGEKCLRDIELFTEMSPLIKLGATLTFLNDADSQAWEPGAALPESRIKMLRRAKQAGVRTWVSFEPVIDPNQTLDLIDIVAPFVDEIKVGRWNHDPRANQIDWRNFGERAVLRLRKHDVLFYVKHDLRKFLPEGFLSPQESDQDFLNLKSAP